jgi:hypothetical protein
MMQTNVHIHGTNARARVIEALSKAFPSKDWTGIGTDVTIEGVNARERVLAALAPLGKAYDPSEPRDERGRWWHGSPSGELVGGSTGLHLGTKEAATQALEARIGTPADGHGWTGDKHYGDTLLAGADTLARLDPRGYNRTGFRAGSDYPKQDFYPKDYLKTNPKEWPKYSNGEKVPLTATPSVRPFHIVGHINNTVTTPYDDFKANGYMAGALKRGKAKSGYYYRNVGEDAGSISVVVPSAAHVVPDLAKFNTYHDPKTGEFASGGEVSGYSKSAQLIRGVIHTDNVYDAIQALKDNRKVELNQPREVATLIKKLGKVAMDMEKHGEKAPNFNLCNVSVEGTNLFCAESKGIPRVKMPQLKDPDELLGYLKDHGVNVEKTREYSDHLRATQDELNGAKVSAMMKQMRKGKRDPDDRRLIVSKDNYIVDGHHHWGAVVGLDASDNKFKTKMKVSRVDMGIIPLLKLAEKFSGPHQAMGDVRNLVVKLAVLQYRLNKYNEAHEPAGSSKGGQFAPKGGGDQADYEAKLKAYNDKVKEANNRVGLARAALNAVGFAATDETGVLYNPPPVQGVGVQVSHAVQVTNANQFPEHASKILEYWQAQQDRSNLIPPQPPKPLPEPLRPMPKVSGELNPKAINVGGDEWNKRTAIRLESEYQIAKPELEKIVTDAVAGKDVVPTGRVPSDWKVVPHPVAGEGKFALQASTGEYGTNPAGIAPAVFASEAEAESAKKDYAPMQGPEEEEEEPPHEPESWDELSDADQESIQEKWIEENKDAFIADEVTSWHDNGDSKDDAASQGVWQFNKGTDKDSEWVMDALKEHYEAREEEGKPEIPFTPLQIANALDLDYQAWGSGNVEKGLNINFKNDKLQEPKGLEPNQLVLPGIEPIKPESMLTEDMRKDIGDTVTKALDKYADDKSCAMEPPEYLSENALEYMPEYFDSKSNKEKFSLAKTYGIVGGEDNPVAVVNTYEKLTELPKHFDPLQTGGGDADYKRTQAVAHYLSAHRAAQIMAERGITGPGKRLTGILTGNDPNNSTKMTSVPISVEDIASKDANLWDRWKSSSTSGGGILLQVATADELGGRLHEYGRVDRARAIEHANEDYKSIGGYAGVKAYIRAKWETSQYMLDKADIHTVNVYRGINMPELTNKPIFSPVELSPIAAEQYGAKYKVSAYFPHETTNPTYHKTFEEAQDAANQKNKEVEANYKGPKEEKVAVEPPTGTEDYATGRTYTKLPDLVVKRNGAASTSSDRDVSNGWDGTPRVVLRAEVPRTAVVSVPAYGINVQHEHEVVIAGTSWVGWDAWKDKAPSFEEVPMAHGHKQPEKKAA